MRKDEKEKFISKLKRIKRKMVEAGASVSETRKIRKSIKKLEDKK